MPFSENQHQDYDYSDEQLREMLHHRSHWIVRQGNLVFLLLLLTFLAFSSIIRYPNFIRGPLKLVAIDAPKLVPARVDGKIDRLLVANEQQVRKEQPLAWLRSTAAPEDVISLENWINEVEPIVSATDLTALLSHPLPSLGRLGGLQDSYQNFQGILLETIQILNGGYYQQKQRSFQDDLHYLAQQREIIKRQLTLSTEDYQLQQKEYNASDTLAAEKVIAPIELNSGKSRLINKEATIQTSANQLFSNDLTQQEKKRDIRDVQKLSMDLSQHLRSAFFDLKSQANLWIQQYAILAPESGKVLFNSFIEEDQTVSAGQELFYLQPPQSSYYGQLMVAQTGLGRIKTGQKVLIRMASYPSGEYGYITGKVQYISNIPVSNDSFLIRVELPFGLRTNYNKTINFRNNLSADAEVITDDRRLISQFFNQWHELTNH
jgi:multidrug resistance efflux pump